jgi:hypothetical protein
LERLELPANGLKDYCLASVVHPWSHPFHLEILITG